MVDKNRIQLAKYNNLPVQQKYLLLKKKYAKKTNLFFVVMQILYLDDCERAMCCAVLLGM